MAAFPALIANFPFEEYERSSPREPENIIIPREFSGSDESDSPGPGMGGGGGGPAKRKNGTEKHLFRSSGVNYGKSSLFGFRDEGRDSRPKRFNLKLFSTAFPGIWIISLPSPLVCDIIAVDLSPEPGGMGRSLASCSSSTSPTGDGPSDLSPPPNVASNH